MHNDPLKVARTREQALRLWVGYEEYVHPCALLEEGVREVGADEAARTGDEDIQPPVLTHRVIMPRRRNDRAGFVAR